MITLDYFCVGLDIRFGLLLCGKIQQQPSFSFLAEADFDLKCPLCFIESMTLCPPTDASSHHYRRTKKQLHIITEPPLFCSWYKDFFIITHPSFWPLGISFTILLTVCGSKTNLVPDEFFFKAHFRWVAIFNNHFITYEGQHIWPSFGLLASSMCHIIFVTQLIRKLWNTLPIIGTIITDTIIKENGTYVFV